MSVLDDNYVLVCAIDFGTTFSGYAFSFKSSPRNISMNKNWGEEIGCQSYKTPSCVLTGPNGEFVAFGHDAENRYGQMVEEDDGEEYDLYRHFKMILHKKSNLTRRSAISSISGTIRPALEIFTMSLNFLKEHILLQLNNQFEGKVDTSLIRWVITVPAIWTEESKQFMREAAFMAGCINRRDSKKLVIALEPEVASVYCRGLDVKQFVNMEGQQTLCFSSGTKYLVIDAGGGTVDITAHEVLGTEMKELHIANGGALGGTKVDEEFTNLLTNIFGIDFIKVLKKEVPQQWFSLMSTFEKVKKSFKLDGKSKINIVLGYGFGSKFQEVEKVSIEQKVRESAQLGVSFRNGCLILNHECAASLFEKVVQGIIDHIKPLFALPSLCGLSYILLVGGFGECIYLQDKLRKVLHHNVTLLVPTEAQLAVIKGAVLFGHQPYSISSRISPKTYGLSVMRKFKQGVHEEERKDTINGVAWCRDIFQSIIKKGDVIEVGKTWEDKRVPHKPEQKSMNIRIFSIDRRPIDSIEYVDAADMKKLGIVKVSMPNIEKGLDRAVMVRVLLGSTEIQVSATDVTSGMTTNASIEMLAN